MRTFTIAIVVILLIATGGYFVLQSQGKLPAALNVQAAEATPMATPIQASNDVVVDAVVVPVQYAALSMASSGIVAAVLVKEGDRVEAGQVIARVDNQRQLLAVAQAQAQMETARAHLAELQAGPLPEEITAAQAVVDGAQAQLNKLKEGAHPADIAAAQAAVNQAAAQYDTVASGPTQAELVAAQADMANAEAVMRQAQSEYNKVKWRSDIGMLQQSLDLEQATNAHEAAKARYETVAAGAKPGQLASANAQIQQARANLDKARSPATVSDLAAAEAEVRRAQAQLDLTAAGARPETIAAAQADLKAAELLLMQSQVDLTNTELKAPFAGTIAELKLKVGEQATAGQPVVQIADQSSWLLETDDLTELNVVHVRERADVAITIDALPGQNFSGTVLSVKPLGESKQGDIVYTAKIEIKEKDAPLRWKMSAAATIRVTP